MLATTRHSFTLSALAAFTTLALLPTGHANAQSVLEAQTTDGDEATMRLSDERVRTVINGQYSTTTVRQTYINETKSVLEGRYIITAGEGARVQGFAYWNGETKIVGDVYEKEVAREVYEEVTGLGRDPGLLEQVGEGSFAFRVFPIAVGEKKVGDAFLQKAMAGSDEALRGAAAKVVMSLEKGAKSKQQRQLFEQQIAAAVERGRTVSIARRTGVRRGSS